MYLSGSAEFNSAIENTQGNSLKWRLKFGDEEIIDTISSMRYYGGSNDTDDISIGNTMAAYVDVSVFADKNINNREFLLECGLELSDGTYEYAPLGYFTVQRPAGDIDEVHFSAYDRMQKFEKVYNSTLTYPTTSDKVLSEICTACGIALVTPIANPITITENLKGYTCREVLGYIAGIHGFFACIDRFGELNLRWYSTEPIEKSLKYTWSFNKSQEPYNIDKIELHKDGETVYTSGSGTRTLYHSNPYATQDIADSLYGSLGGYTYTPAEIEILDDIRLDPWDIIKINYFDGIDYLIPAMVIEHDLGGGATTIKAVGKSGTESEYKFNGPVTNYLNRMSADLLLANRVIATKVDAEYVQAHAITTDNLDAIKADIEEAVIKEVESEFVKTDELEAVEANIKEAVITDLSAKFVTTDQLQATNADVEKLDASVADINTLIFGSASGSVIQTEFANAVIAQLGNAQIKSAMIDSVSASKVTAGTIYTDNVTIQSQNGQMMLSDNTMQISDGTRVRVQIGKDASGDYSINIWDNRGNLMFSQGGITDSAIKSAIIRNDMVSETANISASKLNIDSLFTAINGSSNTIKATQIYLDDEAQALNVAFKSMTSNVDNLQSRVTSQGTELSAIQGQITSKIWQQDINTAVDSISVGGRNLLLDTNQIFEKTTEGQTNSTFGIGSFCDYYMTTRAVGKEITLSFDWETTSTVGEFRPIFNNTPFGLIFINTSIYITPTNQSGKFSYTAFLTEDCVNSSATYTGMWIRTDRINGTTKISNVKFEYGNKATDWTPAPEDTEGQLTELSTRYSLLEQDVDGFKTTVSATYTTKTEFELLEIGGVNILPDSNVASLTALAAPYNRYFSDANVANMTMEFIEVTDVPVSEIKVGIKQVISTKTSSGKNLSWRKMRLDDGETYTISFYARITEAEKMTFRFRYSCDGGGSYRSAYKEITATGDWQRVSCSLTIDQASSLESAPNDLYTIGVAGCMGTYTGTVEMCGFKMERGNKATAWSYALEDTRTNIDSISTIATQTADKFNWLVTSGTSATDFTLTDRMADLTAEIISLNGKVKVNGDMLVDGAVTANKIAIGDFTNLAVINPDNYNPYNYTIAEDDNGVKWFQFGSDTTLNYYGIRMNYMSNQATFKKGDKYIFRGLVKASQATSIRVCLRAYYSDGGSPTYTNMASAYYDNVTTEAAVMEIPFSVNTLPISGRTIAQYHLFLETRNTKHGILYVRELAVHQMTDNVLIADGAITADKINVIDLFAQDILATGTITGATLKGADAEIYRGSIGNWLISDGKLVAQNIQDELSEGYEILKYSAITYDYNSNNEIMLRKQRDTNINDRGMRVGYVESTNDSETTELYPGAIMQTLLENYTIYSDNQIFSRYYYNDYSDDPLITECLIYFGKFETGRGYASEIRLVADSIKLSPQGAYNVVIEGNLEVGEVIADKVTTSSGTDLDTINNSLPILRNTGTFSNQNVYNITGYITSGSTEVILYIPMNFNANIKAATVTSAILSIRTVNGGYLGGALSSDLTQYIASTTLRLLQGILQIQLTKSDGWGITNNTPLCGNGRISYTVS